ncbi:MAG TPA: hypothetical protein VF553_19510 [Pyrinomonadaceae bacterium]|jgi:hypothetical protein
MSKTNENKEELIEAVRDLTRVVLALNGKFTSKSEMIRELNSLSIPPGRIASLLGMKPKDVTSTLSKAKRSVKADSR